MRLAVVEPKTLPHAWKDAVQRSRGVADVAQPRLLCYLHFSQKDENGTITKEEEGITCSTHRERTEQVS